MQTLFPEGQPLSINKFIAGEVGRSVKDLVRFLVGYCLCVVFVGYCIGLLYVQARVLP